MYRGIRNKSNHMIFSDPQLDMQITFVFLFISAAVALAMYLVSKNPWKAAVWLSVLANLSFLVNIGSFMFLSYGLGWLQNFTLFVWPIINVFLVIRFLKKK